MNAESIMHRDMRQLSTLIQGESATHKVYKNGIHGGFTHSRTGLTQHDRKIQAVWTLKRASRVLNEEEAIYCIAQFGGYLDAKNALQDYIDSKAKHLTRAEVEAILEYLFLKQKYKTTIMLQDKFNWSNGQRCRSVATIRRFLAKMHNQCIMKLESALNAEIAESDFIYY